MSPWAAVITVVAVVAMFVLAMLRERYWKIRVAQRDKYWQDDIAMLESQRREAVIEDERDHMEERRRWAEHLDTVRQQRDGWRDEALKYKDALDGKIVFSDNTVIDSRYMDPGSDIQQSVVQDAVRRSAHRIAAQITSKAKVDLESQPATFTTLITSSVYLKDLL